MDEKQHFQTAWNRWRCIWCWHWIRRNEVRDKGLHYHERCYKKAEAA